jgi:GNAT superfamily N-acetyltransferase
MNIINKKIEDMEGIRIAVEENGKEVGRVRLYILKNDVHEQPFGFLEYVIIDEEHQSKGYGTMLVKEVVRLAKERGCYKLIFTSRNVKPQVQQWYSKLGFKDWGKEFRMDF